MKIVRTRYPGAVFEESRDRPDTIVANGTQIGLQNLKATFDQSDRSQHVLEQLVDAHFGILDFHTQPYPLSQNLFEAATDGTITELG